MSLPNPPYMEIDVSTSILDIAAINEFAHFTTGNDADGFDARKHSVVLILMEASDGLEPAVVSSLQAEGFDVIPGKFVTYPCNEIPGKY